ncbi:hypothetical protein [Streptomyces sp. NPDC017941]|uniref:hypothetical protein n=1 Tax=unclassified Streptomyces TaxID=2593676 RepID=UPI0037A8BEF2
MTHRLIRCLVRRGDTAPSADRATFEAFRAMLTALREAEPWTPGRGDAAVRVGPFVERVHPRPGDDHGTDMIAVALVHPDTPHATAYLHGHQLGYTSRGWLRCQTLAILGLWHPAYAMLSHAAANLSLPADVGMSPAHYGVHLEGRHRDGTRHTLLRVGPYSQSWQALRDADRINRAARDGSISALDGCTIAAADMPFIVSDHKSYVDPYGPDGADVRVLADRAIRAAAV